MHGGEAAAELFSGHLLSWFPAHWKSLSVAEFEARWCCSGVIARVAHGSASGGNGIRNSGSNSNSNSGSGSGGGRQALEFLLEAPGDAELQ